jgi:hypothetical protein
LTNNPAKEDWPGVWALRAGEGSGKVEVRRLRTNP